MDRSPASSTIAALRTRLSAFPWKLWRSWVACGCGIAGASGGSPADDSGETIDAAREYCHRDVYQLIIKVRGLMREDLGCAADGMIR